VYGVVFMGRRYDTGDELSYLKAAITLASARVEFGEDLKTWLKAFVS
jgi:UTP--glucose-1-phosphate uridylyltransferase